MREIKKIRDNDGYWNRIELYIESHTEAQFTHSICQQCMDEIYGHEEWYGKADLKDSKKK